MEPTRVGRPEAVRVGAPSFVPVRARTGPAIFPLAAMFFPTHERNSRTDQDEAPTKNFRKSFERNTFQHLLQLKHPNTTDHTCICHIKSIGVKACLVLVAMEVAREPPPLTTASGCRR